MIISTRQFMSPIALTVALLGCAAGCARFGYSELSEPSDKGRDAGADAGSKAGKPARGGGAGRMDADSGASGAAGEGGSAGRDASPDSGSDLLDAATGMSDAGMSDAAQDDDAGNDDPVSCPAHALFCDDFEDPTFSRWSYPVKTNGTLTQSTTRARTGLGSLRATTGAAAAGNEARYATSVLAKQKSGDIWLRYYYYLPSTVTVTTHFSAGVMSEIIQPYWGFALLVRPSRVDLTSMAGPFQGTLSFPRDRWVCVELHVRIHPSTGVFEGYLDGALAVSSTPTNTLPADGFTNAEVGIHYAEAGQGPVEVYVDDVVIAKTRVPCN
jgi:hypothetical protein